MECLGFKFSSLEREYPELAGVGCVASFSTLSNKIDQIKLSLLFSILDIIFHKGILSDYLILKFQNVRRTNDLQLFAYPFQITTLK